MFFCIQRFVSQRRHVVRKGSVVSIGARMHATAASAGSKRIGRRLSCPVGLWRLSGLSHRRGSYYLRTAGRDVSACWLDRARHAKCSHPQALAMD
jgi:hypothetical protein